MLGDLRSRGSIESYVKGKAELNSIEWRWEAESHHFSIERDECVQLFQSDFPNLTNNFLLSCLSYQDQSALVKQFEEAHKSLQKRRFSCCLNLDQGKVSYVEFTFNGDKQGRVLGHLAPLVTFDKNSDFVSQLFEQLFDNPHHGVVIANSEKNVIACNSYFQEHTGYSHPDLAGRNLDKLDSGKHSKDYYQNLWKEVARKGFWSGVILIKTKSGNTIPQDLTVQKFSLGENIFYVGWYLDLSKNLYRVADVEHGGVELLTQLPTEQQFTQSVASRWMDEAEEHISMVVAFVPKFNSEDDFEHKSVLSEHLARNRNAQQVGYIGNNHFVACLECEKRPGPSQVRIIHQTIRRFFSSLNQKAGKEIHLAIVHGKVGVSVLGHDTHNPKLLVSHAVQAMLEQQNDARGLITFYHGAIHREVLRRKELEEWAVKLIRSNAVEVYYQPIVDVKTWDIVKFEALSRFKAPNGKILNTQEMVTVAEDLDLVSDLDWCVGRKALEDLSVIQERYGEKLGMTINRSLNTKLETDEVLQSADDLVHQFAKTPELVTIELTESAYFDSESEQSSLIRNIRRRGVSVAIDDFGTGYSSFSYLSDCNFDLLKIDREFVTGLRVGTHKYHIVKMITELAHTLNVKVVAEGVETRQELEVICSVGVDYIQGYFFSKPLPIDQLESAWSYCERLEEFLTRASSMRQVGILNITQTYIPTLEPQDTLEAARNLFDSKQYNLEVIPVVDGTTCVGVVGREELNHHLSTTLGTKLETPKDLVALKRKLNQVMRRDIHRASYQIKMSEVPELIKSGIKPPWLVVNETGQYLGVVTSQDLLSHFANE
ncbi:EAL domain-containing protein [Vibrio coralliilyticus]|uniref:EAL domain-containing protein n=1 Tax=Vibrio coralliilyticus TaxID=190893 RepID=A0AAP6ZJH2_9VIBR|nr:EAL domain-containing protein [Vibrio coralliilyticus]NOJ22137.1 EAL domain-containing protein [Vibrio coralliilyticus]NRF25745.1 EAL domain-containing protein [Vibrio coralliilyticus]NRF80066.1 EAL domain-containing protein [Vibrio coralliilyticus]